MIFFCYLGKTLTRKTLKYDKTQYFEKKIVLRLHYITSPIGPVVHSPTQSYKVIQSQSALEIPIQKGCG